MVEASSYDATLKVMVVGDSEVGKTSLVQRLVNKSFSAHSVPTVGVDFQISSRRCEHNCTVRIQLWDAAGQDRYRTIISSYYRIVNGIIIAYDTTCAASLERVREWLATAALFGSEGVTLMLVGTKCELRKQRAVPSHVAHAFAKAHGMLFFETSAKSGEGVEEMFAQLMRQMEQPYACAKKQSCSPTPTPASAQAPAPALTPLQPRDVNSWLYRMCPVPPKSCGPTRCLPITLSLSGFADKIASEARPKFERLSATSTQAIVLAAELVPPSIIGSWTSSPRPSARLTPRLSPRLTPRLGVERRPQHRLARA